VRADRRARPSTSHRPLGTGCSALCVALATTLLLAGCGDSSASGVDPAATSSGTGPGRAPTAAATSTPARSTGAAATPDLRTVGVSVTGKQVRPAPDDVRLAVGEAVRLIITSDVANSVHVHGVDLTKDVPAGGSVTFDIAFRSPGAYEVETHDPSLQLLRFVVR
jgi:plastocyanin